MSEDEKKPDQRKNNSGEHLRVYSDEAIQKSADQLEALRAAKKLSRKDSQWTIPQEILQEIMAGYTIANPNSLPPLTEMVEDLKKEINTRYADDTETRDILLRSIPTMRSVREWVKKDGWEEAVWGYVRGDGLFTPAKRAQMIESLRTRGLDKSDVAAKIWLTLSGDYSEKMEVDNKSVDVYREINNIIHGNKKKTE